MENEIRVGNYIRTNRGIILKVVKIEFDEEANQNYYMGEEICSGCFQEMVKIHSPNIIDLIYKEDYVNGCKVYENHKTYLIVYQKVKNSEVDYNYINHNEIETIVTREMIDFISYKVER